MKYWILLPSFYLLVACNSGQTVQTNIAAIKSTIHKTLDAWHHSAANADLENYIGTMDSASIYIGTDATENWNRKEFYTFCKPYFDKKKTWNFTPLERNIFLSEQKTAAWFDELLDTQMGICRGSGVLELKGNEWKIKHYVLSMTIPNDNSAEVIQTKKEFDTILLENYQE